MSSPREPKPQKREIVSQLSEKLAKAAGVILTEYRGLTVADLTQLRMKLRQIQGELRILQNRLTKISFKGVSGSESLHRYLTGPTAAIITYGDPVLMAKIITEFSVEKGAFRVKAGLVAGRFLDPPGVARMASLPSRQVLIGTVVGMIASPLRRLVTALSQPQRGLVQVLAQVARKKS